MKYLVIEIQKFDGGTMSTISFSYDDINEAEAKYHSILSTAAISSVPIHSAVLLNETGYHIKHESFNHMPPPEPEPEPDPDPEDPVL